MSRIGVFISTFGMYCILFLATNNWTLTSKQIVEMIFIGGLSSLVCAWLFNRITRLIEHLIERVLGKK